jgi:hypothetical protein
MDTIKINILIICILVIIGCSQEKNAKSNEKTTIEINPISADRLSADQDYINKIISLKTNASERELIFITELQNTISKFDKKPADTLIIQLVNLDDIDPLDTIYNRIFIRNDTVFLKSKWSRKNELLWSSELVDPYLWISDRNEFAYDTRSVWVTFTIAINYSLPNFLDANDFPQISKETAIAMGSADLNRMQFDTTELPEYLTNFHGQLLENGDPELRQGLFIWHEPSKKFIYYYRP